MRLARHLLVILVALLAVGATSSIQPAAAAGDDYLWRTDTSRTGDWFNFTKRQCVSFAAWELYQRKATINNSARSPWGNASNWDAVAVRFNKSVTRTPRIGSIAQWHANERSLYYSNMTTPNGYVQAGGYGHVAVVVGVYGDNSVKVEQYNMSGNRSFSVMRVKAPRYIFVG